MASSSPSGVADRPAAADTATGTQRAFGHVPALDGLRGLAFAMVFVAHAGFFGRLALGSSAMFLFFALSGFLITVLLVAERDRTGRVDMRRFFARRALRLVPALAVLLGVWLCVALACHGAAWLSSVPQGGPGHGVAPTVALEGVAASLGFVANWVANFGLFVGYFPLMHLWSLSVEEQFYVAWAPLLALLLARARRLVLPVALVLAACSSLDVNALVHTGHHVFRVYTGTDARAGAFLLGGALAVAWSHGWLEWCRRLSVATALALAAGYALVWSGPVLGRAGPATYAADWTVATVAAAGLVAAAVVSGRGPVGRLLRGRAVTYLGRRSYALYLWHYVWLTWFAGLGSLRVPLALACSLASAELSWRLVESRALRLKNRLDPARAPQVPPPREVARDLHPA